MKRESAWSQDRQTVKFDLIRQYGTLRSASVDLGINYYRLGNLLNGWLEPSPAEAKKILASIADFKKKAGQR